MAYEYSVISNMLKPLLKAFSGILLKGANLMSMIVLRH